MHMRHTLTHVVVTGDKRAIGWQAFFYGLLQQLGILKERPDKRSRQICERLIMLFWH